MTYYNWNDWYLSWGWFLWFGVIFLLFSSAGNWGYTYQAHRKFDSKSSRQNSIEILNERYARGELKHEDYNRIKAAILITERSEQLKTA